jgi:hypothetical protein
MKLIIKMLQKFSEFYAELIVTMNKSSSKIFDANKIKYSNILDRLDLIRKVERMKTEVKFDKKMKNKAFIYSIISFIGTIGSILLTLCGITGSSFKELLDTSQNIAYVILICFMQGSVWIIASNSTYIRTHFYKQYSKLLLLQYSSIFTSVICNYMFLVNFQKPKGILFHIFLIILACSIDLISLVFASLANDCRWGNKSSQEEIFENGQGILHMLLFNITSAIRLKIRTNYVRKLNEYNNIFQTNLVQKVRNEKTPILLENKRDSSNISSENFEPKSAIISNQIGEVKQQNIQIPNAPSFRPFSDVSETDFEPVSNKLPIGFKPVSNENDKILKSISNKVSNKTETVRNDKQFETLKKRISEMDSDTKISIKEIAPKMSSADWRKYRSILVKENILYTSNSNTYKK